MLIRCIFNVRRSLSSYSTPISTVCTQSIKIHGIPVKGDVFNFTLNGDAVSIELTDDDGTDFTIVNIKINNTDVPVGSYANLVDFSDMTLTSLGNEQYAVGKAAAAIVNAMGDRTDGGTQGGMTVSAVMGTYDNVGWDTTTSIDQFLLAVTMAF